jgi:hypothetical protein
MERYLIGQMTQSNILDPIINFEIIEAESPKKAKIKYAKKHKISKHYAFLAAHWLKYYFDKQDVWSITGNRDSFHYSFKFIYEKLKELGLKPTDTCESLYKTYQL